MTRVSIRRRFKRYPKPDECVPIINLNATTRQVDGRLCIDLDARQLEQVIIKTIVYLARERMAQDTGEALIEKSTLAILELFADDGSEL